MEIEIEDREYATAEEKIREEMWVLKDRDFADILSQHLLHKCEEESFSSLVLQKHKTLYKCLNYVMEQAYHIAEKKHEAMDEEAWEKDQNVGLAIFEVQVYQWAEEYYALDDAEAEAKKKEEEKKAIEKEHEQGKHPKGDKRTARAAAKTKAKESTDVIKKEPVPEKNEEAQLSLFDMMSGATDKGEENESI